MRYIISDTHFGHENVIEYCRRPFSSVEEMNETLVSNWNATVDDNDTIIHLGDVRHHPDINNAAEWFERLNGQILLVRGNHDGGVAQNATVHTVETCTIKHGRYTFYLEHQPVSVSGWQIHGHTHQSDLTIYPFVNHSRQTVNVSAEVIGYQPLPMDTLVSILDEGEDHKTITSSIMNDLDGFE